MTPDQSAAITAYLAEARWFGGKGRAFEVTAVTRLPLAPDVTTNLVQVTFTPSPGSEAPTDLYQVPLASYDEEQDRLTHAYVGFWDGRHHYDAVHDRDAMQVWLRAFAGETDTDLDARVAFRRTAEHDLDLETHSTLFSGEQSNSSLAFGEDSLLKIFRRLTPGTNPDVEIHEALTRSGSTHVAALYGYAAVASGIGSEIQLAMLQQFLRTASDGWVLALASARNLFTEADLHAHEVGGDFAGEAHRLGVTLAEVHGVLADTFGTGSLDASVVVAAMAERLAATVQAVPEVAVFRNGLAARFAAVGDVSGLTAQRVHGDLHLGQTLRTSLDWKIVDFEGEPARDLAVRRLPDSPWRDVAGMIRSFDYAALSVARDLSTGGDEALQVAYRASEWTARNTDAFLVGYAERRGTPITDAERTLLTAYVADKAVYEVAYETRNRPGWASIPMAALTRLAGENP